MRFGAAPLVLSGASVTVVFLVTASCRARAMSDRISDTDPSIEFVNINELIFGTAMAARMARIASVTISSMSVKPLLAVFERE